MLRVTDQTPLSIALLLLTGRLLGYRALNTKLRIKYKICVPRNVVYTIMQEEFPQYLEERRPILKKKLKRVFTSEGVDFLYSMDGHDKMMVCTR